MTDHCFITVSLFSIIHENVSVPLKKKNCSFERSHPRRGDALKVYVCSATPDTLSPERKLLMRRVNETSEAFFFGSRSSADVEEKRRAADAVKPMIMQRFRHNNFTQNIDIATDLSD